MVKYLFISLFIFSSAQSHKKISLDFENEDLRTIINYITEGAEKNIVLGKEVSGRVTIKMFDKPWDEALESVLKMTGYAFKRYGDIIYIDTPDNLTKETGGKKTFVVYKVRSTNLLEVTKKIESLISPQGLVLSDERTGQIIVFDNPDVQQKVKMLIEKFDTPIHQVMVDVKILNISSVLNEALEQKWNFSLMQIPLIRSNLFLMKEPTVAGYVEAKLGILPFRDSVLQINLLSEQAKDFEIAGGLLLVQENHQGSITTGERFGVSVRDVAGNTVTQFYTSGFKLTVIPHTISDKKVRLTLKFELSTLDRASALVGRPITTTYESEVEICLVDGETEIISRKIDLGLEKGERGPCFLRIPLIKYLFRPWTRTKGAIYQYLLITPSIVS